MKKIILVVAFLAFVSLWSQVFASAIADNTTIIAEGDSISAGYKLGAGEDWPSVLMTTPNFAGKGTKYNFAVSSSEVNWLDGRYQSKVYPLRPQNGERVILFVWAGTNDILVTDQSAAEVYAELESYWTRAKNDGFEVWAFTIIERANFTPAERTQAQELNRLIRESTVWHRLVDVAPLFPDPANTNLYLDGIHPTALGSVKIAQFVNDLANTDSSNTKASAQTLSTKQLFATDNIGIGTITPQQALDVTGNIQVSGRLLSSGLTIQNSTGYATARLVGDGQPSAVMIDRYVPNVNSGVLQLRKARGSSAGPANVLKGDNLGAISYWAYNDGAFRLSSYVTSKVDDSPNGSVVPGNLQFYTVNSSGALTLGLQINKDGNIKLPAVYSSTVSSARDLQIDSTGKIGYVSSSARYKEDINDLSSTDWLYGLRPVSFEYIADTTNTKQVGLIAEEVENVVKDLYPDLISYSSTNPSQVETVNYSKLIVPLLHEAQQLNNRLARLEEYFTATDTIKISEISVSDNTDLQIKPATGHRVVIKGETAIEGKLVIDSLEFAGGVSSGQKTLSANQQSVFVETPTIEDGDTVVINPIYKESLINQVGLVQLYRGEIKPKEGFFVHAVPANLPEDIEFDWVIIKR